MKILIGFERSGIVRDAFIANGNEVISCDLKPTEKPGPHYCGNIFDIIDFPFDLAIFHPECTNTAVSGSKYFNIKKFDGRQQVAVSFFYHILKRSEHIKRVAIEQPISIISSFYRKPDQIIQPWQFGHPESKATCLWLKNLPPLYPTNVLQKPQCGYWENQTPSGQNKLGPSPERAMNRARTYLGIAQAMAQQWGNE